MFFGLGGYCMAMFLKLEASTPENTKIQSTPGIPDFMDWNQVTELPCWWEPFNSLPFTLVADRRGADAFAFIIGLRCSSGASAASTSPSSRRRSR